MPSYSTFQGSAEYSSKFSGAAFEVLIVDAADPKKAIIGAVASLNNSDRFGASGVEEMGNDGVDEWVDERHDGNGSISHFWTPEWNDNLPTRQNWIGKSVVIFKKLAEGRPGAGNIVNVYTGAKLTSIDESSSARGIATSSISFVYSRRYNGKEWAELAGET